MSRLLGVFVVAGLITVPQIASADSGQYDKQLSGFVTKYWSQWSQSNAVALPYVRAATADSIDFYGKTISIDEFMKIQNQFASRWSTREYSLQTNSLSFACNDQNTLCKASGLVNWIDSSAARNATSIGSAKFVLDISVTGDSANPTFKLTGESGSVIHRALLNSPIEVAQTNSASSPQPAAPAATTQPQKFDPNTISQYVRPCWAVDEGAPGVDGFSVNLTVQTDASGTVHNAVVSPQDQSKLGDPIFNAFAQHAIAAVMNYQCATLPLPSYMLGKTQTFSFLFSPSGPSITYQPPPPTDSDAATDSPPDKNSWYSLTNDNDCILSTEPSSPAALIQLDQSDNLDDETDILDTDEKGNPVAVKVEEPEANEMVSIYTFFRGRARCEAYAKSQQDQLNKLQ